MAIKVSSQEYAEFKRLTQKINRRIKSHQKEYAKAGLKIIPKELTQSLGGIQHKSQYKAGELTPLSRGLKQFKNKEDFNKQMSKLKAMADNPKSTHYMPTVKEYANLNRDKLKAALNTAGIELDKSILQSLNKMSTPEIAEFWKDFGMRATRKGAQYSSDAVFEEMLSGEDFRPYIAKQLIKKKRKKNN